MIIILLFVVLFFLLVSIKEPYEDITPHPIRDAIFTSPTLEETKHAGMDCYKWCMNWAEPGGSESCRTRCFDDADLQSDQLKWNYAIFGNIVPHVSYKLLYSNDYF